MSFIGSVLSIFTGSGGQKIAEVADEAFHTEQEKSQEDSKDLESARAMQMTSHNTVFDVLVDGISRLIRPFVTIMICGGLFGFWTLPEESKIAPFWQNMAVLCLTFWFGGRAILKDLPDAIKAMRK